MPTLVKLALLVLLALASEADSGLIARVERTELLVSGKPYRRIEKDAEGNIIRLQLDGMQLTAEEFAALGKVTTLRYLALNKTNVTKADLRHLQNLKQLQGLQLNSTELADDALGELIKVPALRSVCLGSVAISPEAITRLKNEFEVADRKLGVGYSQRKP
jgi:hypothetical protein